MDNATRRQLLEQAKQVGYTGSILDVFQNPQVLDQFVQEQQTQQQTQQVQQPQQIEMPTPPATTPNYRVPQPRQSEAQPLVMSNTEVPIQIRRNGGILYETGGDTESITEADKRLTAEMELQAKMENLRNAWNNTASSNLKNLYTKLDAEKERVAKVRANVPMAAKQLDEGDNFRHTQGMGEDLRPYNNYLTAKNPKELETARQALSPRIKNLLINQGKYNVAQWDASKGTWNPQATPARELYCTPYGCFTYQLAGANDVPIVGGNVGLVDMIKKGKLPFEEVSDPEQGDLGVLVGAAPKVYTKPELGNTIRPHHTVIYDSTDANGNVNAYNAFDGTRLNYTKTNFQLEPSNTNSPSQYMNYYRYIGDTKNLQNQINKITPSNLLSIEQQFKEAQLKNADLINSTPKMQGKDATFLPREIPQLKIIPTDSFTASKKYGGKKCYTCNQSNLQVLYNKRNYKK